MAEPNPTRWTDAPGETFTVWSTETPDVPAALRSLAAIMEADPDLVLYTFVNGPGEPSEPHLCTIQATLSRSTPTPPEVDRG